MTDTRIVINLMLKQYSGGGGNCPFGDIPYDSTQFCHSLDKLGIERPVSIGVGFNHKNLFDHSLFLALPYL